MIRQARRRLSQNPTDIESLTALGEYSFEEENYEQARKHYESLLHLCPANPDLDELRITTRLAITCLELKDYKEAYVNLAVARTLDENSFEVNYHLGYMEYLRKRYEIASELLRKAVDLRPDHTPSARYLGLCLTKRRHYPEAVRILDRVIEAEPDDKEAAFAMGQCQFELDHSEKALRIFRTLRADPRFGPRASLYLGSLDAAAGQYADAAQDFEIGLRHEKIPPEVLLELQYRLALVRMQQQQISRGLALLKAVARREANYKNVPELIDKYQELLLNENLQTYLVSSKSDFLALCRKIASNFYAQARSKLVDVAAESGEYVDILAEVESSRWADVVLFRFSRSSGNIGEFALRELYGRIREVKAGRAFFVSAGGFSEGAQKFVEARLIDLVDKEQLIEILARADFARSPKKRTGDGSG